MSSLSDHLPLRALRCRMKRELKAFYEQLERNVQQEIELSRIKMEEAQTELRQLTKLHNKKNAVSRINSPSSQIYILQKTAERG